MAQQLRKVTFVSPGRNGLNLQAEASLLGPEWATVARNAVFDEAGRLSARKGTLDVTTTPATGTPQFVQMFEYLQEDGTTRVIMSGGDKLWEGVDAPSDITGTATVGTDKNNWQFVNFIDNVYGFQQGEQPIVKSGAGNFADLTAASGTAPQGNAALAAFGRIWAVGSDKQTIQYSALLDPTKWAVSDGAGSIDMTSVWPAGMDQVVAITAFNGMLIVFGRRTIVMWTDGQGSELGLDPTQIYVVDTVIGPGATARDTVRQIDSGDVLFLSDFGLQSLGRVIQVRSNPVINLSKNVQDNLRELVASESTDEIRATYSPEEKFYVLAMPVSGETFVFDTRGTLDDGALRVTKWEGLNIRAALTTRAGDTYFALAADGQVFQYSGNLDMGSPYSFTYQSGNITLGEDVDSLNKILKQVEAILLVDGDGTATLRWQFDFDPTSLRTRARAFDADSNASIWGVFQWGLGSWGAGDLQVVRVFAAADGTGQYIKLGLSAPINDIQLSLQQIAAKIKLGRII